MKKVNHYFEQNDRLYFEYIDGSITLKFYDGYKWVTFVDDTRSVFLKDLKNFASDLLNTVYEVMKEENIE